MSGRKGITPEQKLEAYNRTGSCNAAARELGIDKNAVWRTLKNMGALNQDMPIDHRVRGISTLVGADGKPVLQWVKTAIDSEKAISLVREAVEALKEEVPKEKPSKTAPSTEKELLCTYVLTDYHIGQLSWAEETGEEWNTDIAENLLVGWFRRAIEGAPKADTAILAQLGDFLHYDSLEALTPTSKHILDADARYAKIVRVAIRALVRIISILLEKHKNVIVLMAEGNHDMASSVWLRELFHEKYSKEPRVRVDNTCTPYYAYEWGKTSLFFHHGHKKKMSDVSRTFAGMYRDIFGRTKYSYAHMGHMHHIEAKEDALMVVEQHPTMSAKDAHATRGGYVSNRGASVITYSKEYGEVSRITIRPEMIK